MLSKNIKTIRKSKGLSQDELAVKLNVVRQTISKWENGVSQTKGYWVITCVYLLAKILMYKRMALWI